MRSASAARADHHTELPVLAALALAWALLPGCYLAHERATPDSPRECTTAPVDGCTRWEAAGPPTLISGPVLPAGFPHFGSAIATDCGVLAAWSVTTRTPTVMSVRHETRTADWSGAVVDAILAHPTFVLDGSSPTTPLLARGPGGAAGLVANGTDCLFVPLALDGHERGEPVRVATAELCGALAGTPGGYSFITAVGAPTSRFALSSVDAVGTTSTAVDLVGPSGRALWTRTVFDDGSFLAYSFTEDFVTTRYSGWLQHFGADGVELAVEVELDENAVPVLTTSTARGALAAWSTAASGGLPLRVRPIDRDGRPTGEARDVPAEGALYGFALASTPDGDAVLSWTESHWRGMPEWRLRVLALGPDGAPRGAPTTVLTDLNTGAGQLLVEPSGGRALFFFGDDTGVRAQPLVCVP